MAVSVGFILGVALALSAREGLGPLEAAIFGIAGYLIGTLAVELVINRPPPSAGVASLTPRLISQFVPARALAAFRAGALLFWVFEGLYLLTSLKGGTEDASMIPETGPGRFISITIALAVLVGGVEGILRLIVSRRQPTPTEEQRKIDNALRSASAHTVTGGGLALLCLAIAGEALAFGDLDGPAGSVARTIGAAAMIAALAAWLVLSKPQAFQAQTERVLPS